MYVFWLQHLRLETERVHGMQVGEWTGNSFMFFQLYRVSYLLSIRNLSFHHYSIRSSHRDLWSLKLLLDSDNRTQATIIVSPSHVIWTSNSICNRRLTTYSWKPFFFFKLDSRIPLSQFSHLIYCSFSVYFSRSPHLHDVLILDVTRVCLHSISLLSVPQLLMWSYLASWV